MKSMLVILLKNSSIIKNRCNANNAVFRIKIGVVFTSYKLRWKAVSGMLKKCEK